VRDYCELLQTQEANELAGEDEDDPKKHPGPTVAALMKLSFDEEHRHAMCQLGGLHAVAQLIQADHEAHGSNSTDQYCITLRR
jgi:adenomatosis polyposis coli protein